LGRINKLTGRVAPLFTSKSIEGDLIKLKDLRGKYILLNFWAPWCKPCVEEMPILNRIYQAYNAENIKLIISIALSNFLVL
jgi:thiol-disulfide isomerase/thioredoxin